MAEPTDAGRSRFYRSRDGLRLHLRDYDPGAGAATPLICLAGLTRSADDFDLLARHLAFAASVPRRVVAFDYRGRGSSDHDPDWHHYESSVEWADVLEGLATCAIEAAHWLGTSRGGLNIMTAAPEAVSIMRSVVLNDIGPVIETTGLKRIQGYVGQPVQPRDLAQAIQILKLGAGSDFSGLDEAGWRVFATTTFGSDPAKMGLRYDPALAHGLASLDLAKPLPDLWKPFEALRGHRVLVIRGEHSDILSDATMKAMAARWPECESYVVPGQGHAPLLADMATMDRIARFLEVADDPSGQGRVAA